MSEATETVGPQFPSLLPLPGLSGRKPVPQAYFQAAELHEQAMDEAQDDSYDRAAEGFLKAARTLKVPAEDPYVKGVESCRWVAYQNAWSAFRAAGKADDGRTKLLKAAREDPALEEKVKALVK